MLRIGDIIVVTEMIDDDWWRGKCGNRTGMFPVAFVELIN